MPRHGEPNSSYYSARYAERKRAAERSRDAVAKPGPCNKCQADRVGMEIFCRAHQAEYDALCASGASIDECAAFCRRTYWPETDK